MNARETPWVERLTNSKIYQDYQAAFGAVTGLPLSLHPVEAKPEAAAPGPWQNPFCLLMSKTSRGCAACCEVQARLHSDTQNESSTATCFAGLVESSVPLRIGDKVECFLHTGQVLLQTPSANQFASTAQTLMAWGYQTDLRQFEEAWFHSRVLDSDQYQAMVRLITIFAHHLSSVANQLAVGQQSAEPPIITRAKQFIREHQEEEIDLARVAKAVNTSAFHFCKLFKKATGLTFTHYVARVRVERAKNLLMNPHTRVSEVAFESGFQSLTHFNRVFRRVAGVSPTNFRRASIGHE